MASEYIYSVCLAISAALQGDANLLGVALGKGPGSYSVPLSQNGELPATHYALQGAETANFIAALTSGDLPAPQAGSWGDNGLTAARVGAVLGGLLVSVDLIEGGKHKRPALHFLAFLAENNLIQIETNSIPQ